MPYKETLADLKKVYDDIAEDELALRNRINALRRDLTQLCKRRVRAYNAWQAESKRLVG
jgi:hypothetical protein